jgi:hypothetical protein
MFKTSDKRRKSQQKYYARNRKKCRLMAHKSYWKYRTKNLIREANKRYKTKQKVIELLGDSCKVCGSKKDVQYHNIKLTKHPTNSSYILKHVEDFVCLCRICHRTKHGLLTLSDSQINALIKL